MNKWYCYICGREANFEDPKTEGRTYFCSITCYDKYLGIIKQQTEARLQ